MLSLKLVTIEWDILIHFESGSRIVRKALETSESEARRMKETLIHQGCSNIQIKSVYGKRE
jgi:hypothetical protein